MGVSVCVGVCPEQESNLHDRYSHMALNHARLPIPPPGQMSVSVGVYFVEECKNRKLL